MALQKIPLQLVAGDDRAFIFKVLKGGEPVDLSGADLRCELQASIGSDRYPLTVIGGNGKVVLVLRNKDTEHALWRTADADIRLVSENGVSTLLGLHIRLLPRVTRVNVAGALSISEVETATIKLEDSGVEVEIAETETGEIIQLDQKLHIVYTASDDIVVRNRLAALELRTDTLTAAAAEMDKLSQEMAGIKEQTNQISVIDARLREMAKTVSEGLLAQAQLADFGLELNVLQAAVGDKATAADIVRLSRQIADIQIGINSLQEAAADAASAGVVVDLTNQIAQLQEQMANDKKTLDLLIGNVADGAKLAALAADVTTLSDKVDTAMSAASEIRLLQTAVTTLQEQARKADESVVKALASRVAALETQIIAMPKYKEYQAGYISRENFIGAIGNGVLVTANFPKPFIEKPLVFVLIDVADTSARYQSVNNVTETGFQFAINYAPSMRGVSYMAFVPAG